MFKSVKKEAVTDTNPLKTNADLARIIDAFPPSMLILRTLFKSAKKEKQAPVVDELSIIIASHP